MATLILNGKQLTISQLGELAEAGIPSIVERRVWLSPEATGSTMRSFMAMERVSHSAEPFYGINTGFGPLCTKTITTENLDKLQENLLVSHAVGVGARIPDELVRVMLAIKINSLVKGYSGVSTELVNLLVEFLNHDILPHVPSQGSVGASGDLAPLAHMALPVMGMGRVTFKGREMDAAEALKAAVLKPHKLRPKEGLALLNGTQFMSAYGALAIYRARRLAKAADINTAMCLEALRGSIKPFAKKVHDLRPFPGQRQVANNMRQLMADSEILESHKNCGKVQDPYSLRCAPQVHGASRDALGYSGRVIEIEINSATDNPLIFEDGEVISQGNFHGQPVALTLDFLAMAVAELASISERRIYLLLSGEDELPKLLMRDTGLNSGFMIPQYTAAALVSENKVLCHPAVVDSIPTSLGQEDHVSMGAISATKLMRVLENAEAVLGIELMCAAQGVDYRLPLKPGAGVVAALERVRRDIPHTEQDHLFAPEIQKAIALVRSGNLVRAVEEQIGELA
ncbi:histidine ammonia-lyase [Candidatus Poribacteria bacterium]|nr:histidine ammonia-lyase [Candidatus Poribacteria bacterium]